MCNTRHSCAYTINFSKWLIEFCYFNVAKPLRKIHSLMFTRLLNVKWCSYILDNAHLSSGFISFAWVDHNLTCNGSLYIHSFFKWLNLNHFPSLREYHSPLLPITVKRFLVLKTNGCFHACLVSHTNVNLIFVSLGGHLCLMFENGWLGKSIIDWNNEKEQVTRWVWLVRLRNLFKCDWVTTFDKVS